MSRNVLVKGSSAAADVAEQTDAGAPKPPPVRKTVAATPLAPAPPVPSVVAAGKGISPKPRVPPSVSRSAPPVIQGVRPADRSTPPTTLESKSLFELLDASGEQSPARTPSASVSQPTDVAAPLWPSGVPQPERALELLRGKIQDETWSASLAKLRSQLTDVESSALRPGGGALDLSGLRNAVVTRFRLAAALNVKPAPDVAVDGAALERLLDETDVVLSKLQLPEAATEPVRAAFTAARSAMAKDAVALSEIAAEIARRAAEDAAASKATQKYSHVARIVAASTDTAKIALRSKVLWALTAISFLGAGAFHGYRHLKNKSEVQVLMPDAPPGVNGFKNEALGISVFQIYDKTKPADPGMVAELKKKAEATGKTLHEVGPGEFILAPSSMKISDVASPSKPGTP